MYVTALVHFNLARCARHCEDAAQLREATVASVRLLEEAADHFESIGQRERAFDCFQVLAQMGRDGGAFEDVLEGFVNSIRILREDHLKYFALQHYDEAIGAAFERGEAGAAATLAREAAATRGRSGSAPAASGYALRQAELWRMSGGENLERGAPPEIAENALLASVLAFGEVGQAASRRRRCTASWRRSTSSRRATSTTPARRSGTERRRTRRSRPRRAAERGARNGAHVNEVWRVDVLEWERAGSAAEACADVMLDRRFPEFIRRRAMLARLTALEAEAAPKPTGARRPSACACASRASSRRCSSTPMLSPLEHLFAQRRARARGCAWRCSQAIETLFFKRSFATVRAGLADADPAVVAQAVRAVGAFEFEHAFDPLARLVRESDNPDARAAALRALAHIDTIDAAELLLGVLEHGSRHERAVVADALEEKCGARFTKLARSRSSRPPRAPEGAELHALLRRILSPRKR